MFLQLAGTVMGTRLAPPYACLRVGSLGETIFFSKIITITLYINWIEDDWRNIWTLCKSWFCLMAKDADIGVFKEVHNELHP